MTPSTWQPWTYRTQGAGVRRGTPRGAWRYTARGRGGAPVTAGPCATRRSASGAGCQGQTCLISHWPAYYQGTHVFKGAKGGRGRKRSGIEWGRGESPCKHWSSVLREHAHALCVRRPPAERAAGRKRQAGSVGSVQTWGVLSAWLGARRRAQLSGRALGTRHCCLGAKVWRQGIPQGVSQ